MITLTFDELTPDHAAALLERYEALLDEYKPVPHETVPLPDDEAAPQEEPVADEPLTVDVVIPETAVSTKKPRKPRSDKGAPRVTKAAASAPKTGAQVTTVAEEPTTALTAAAPTEDDAIKALKALFHAKGYKASMVVLGRYGVTRAADVKPEERVAFVAECARKSAS